MNDDELALNCMREERDEFENKVFEVLFGADARPPKTIGEYVGEWPSRVFGYEDAQEALAEVSKSLQLLHMIKEHLDTNGSWCGEEDTEENYQMRELIDRLARELPTTGE